MRKIAAGLRVAFLALASVTPALTAPVKTDGDVSQWKTFSNRAGWSIKYPRNWRPFSCHNCTDLTDPKVFVSFRDTTPGNDLITVEHLADKPPGESLDRWLHEISLVNQNPIVSQERIVIDGLPALKVRNRNPHGPADFETIYVVKDTDTFSIDALDIKNAALYGIYQKMVSTFKFNKR